MKGGSELNEVWKSGGVDQEVGVQQEATKKSI